MTKNLVIVESPAKAKTIEKFLGKDYKVKSCNGHVRDLYSNKISIDIENNFLPEYEVLKEKQKLVKELKEATDAADVVWLATDEDREGEAISWHLASVLELKEEKIKRIVFHEITKNAILNSIEEPRKINMALVNAQQARRVLDRLVGYKLSPVLWKKVQPKLSAGRVQSAAVRLVVDREREIINFVTTVYFKVVAEFDFKDKNESVFTIKAELNNRLDTIEETREFLTKCISSIFKVSSVEKKAGKKFPAPPFTTSTLQQEAARKLGFSVSQTMQIAQKLYEAGHITYMRTDSVRLSDMAIGVAKEEIIKNFGEKYSQPRHFTTKSKSAQEAHEAIRPSYISNRKIALPAQESRLYELIWNRTVASQMSDAQVEKTTIKIDISNNSLYFVATGEVIVFDGFLKLYLESNDDELSEDKQALLPAVAEGQILHLNKIIGTERYTRPPLRYSEAALVKRLEELGIGRPSTFAPTITTIIKRTYVTKDSKEGKERPYRVLTLDNNKIAEQTKSEIIGADKGKLSPSSIGMMVNDFLVANFEDVINYTFTAEVEDKFDEIANNNIEWQSMIGLFYKSFEPIVAAAEKTLFKSTGERFLGVDPVTKMNVYAKLGKYGPYAQLGESKDEIKPKYARFKKGQLIESILLEEALELFLIPRTVGMFEGSEIVANIGRFGPYVGHNKKFYALPRTSDPYSIDIEESISLIIKKREDDVKKNLKTFNYQDAELRVLQGRFGPYVSFKGKNYKIPRGTDVPNITLEQITALLDSSVTETPAKPAKKAAPAKKKATKKTVKK